MATNDLTFHGLATGLGDGREPRLQLATPKGYIREVELSRRELVKLIQRAAAALEELDRREGV